VIPGDAFTFSRVKFAAERLTEMVRAHRPGDRIGRKEEIRVQVGVSHGTFNEALRILQADGLLTLRPGPKGGVFAARQSSESRFAVAVLQLQSAQGEVAQAVRIRAALEPLVVEDAVGTASPVLIARMRRQLEDMQQAVLADTSGLLFVRSNWALHLTIAEASPHAALRDLYTSLVNMLEEHTVAIIMAGGTRLESHHQDRYAVHRDLVDAIEADDMAAALEAVHRHNADMSEVNRAGIAPGTA
jgi:DNA-binding FadR family transcriptional regulator